MRFPCAMVGRDVEGVEGTLRWRRRVTIYIMDLVRWLFWFDFENQDPCPVLTAEILCIGVLESRGLQNRARMFWDSRHNQTGFNNILRIFLNYHGHPMSIPHLNCPFQWSQMKWFQTLFCSHGASSRDCDFPLNNKFFVGVLLTCMYFKMMRALYVGCQVSITVVSWPWRGCLRKFPQALFLGRANAGL